VTYVVGQSALSLQRAPGVQRRLVSGGLESTSVDDVGDVLGRAGSQTPVGEPLAQLRHAQLALGRQRRGLGAAVDVRVFAVIVEPRAQGRHRAGRQRPRTTSTTASPPTPTPSRHQPRDGSKGRPGGEVCPPST